MTKSIFLRIVLIAASALIITGVLLMNWMLDTSDERNVIKIRLADGITEAVEFEDLSLIPGDSCEYVIVLNNERSMPYDLDIKFVETEEKTLKNFAFVKVISGNEVICDELLADAFAGEGISLPVDFEENKNTIIKIVYYMPIEVGNEAKNAEAKFELQLTASNE